MSSFQTRTLSCLLALAFSASAATNAATQPSPTTEPLLYSSNLQYLGAFRLPEGTTNQTSFSFGGDGLGYDPTKNALFITGHTWYQYTAEVSIPSPVNSTNISTLPTATLLQPLTDALDGKRTSVNPSDPNAQNIGGYLVYNGNLVVSVYSYYDGSGTQSASHFVRPLNLSTTGQVKGPFRVGTLYPGFVSGYMNSVPTEWQSLLGGPDLTGNCCLNIISEQSSGPSVSVFSPSDLGGTNPTPATELLGYPISTPLAGYGSTFTQPTTATAPASGSYFNGSTKITGIVFPNGSRSVLFFGRQGLGKFCYGEGTSNSSLAGQPADGGADLWCYDPVDSSKGTHAYPYTYEVWAYDANDLLKVKQGQEAPQAVKPYAVWALNPPINPGNTDYIGGVAYNSTTNRLYISQECVDTNCSPIIAVYQINLSGTASMTTSKTPEAPTNAQVQ